MSQERRSSSVGVSRWKQNLVSDEVFERFIAPVDPYVLNRDAVETCIKNANRQPFRFKVAAARHVASHPLLFV